MSAPNRKTGKAPRQRPGLRRGRVRKEFQLQEDVYEKLLSLQRLDSTGHPEPLVGVVERLIETFAKETPRRLL